MIKKGSEITINYVGKFDDGNIFEKSDNLKFIVGDGTIIPELENELIGLTVGDKKTIVSKSYHNNDILPNEELRISKSKFDNEPLRIGQYFTANYNGISVIFEISDITDDEVVLVPYKKPITVEVEILSVKEA